MGSWTSKLSSLCSKARPLDLKLSSDCCNNKNETNSYSYQICGRCGSRVNLAQLKNSEYDIHEKKWIT